MKGMLEMSPEYWGRFLTGSEQQTPLFGNLAAGGGDMDHGNASELVLPSDSSGFSGSGYPFSSGMAFSRTFSSFFRRQLEFLRASQFGNLDHSKDALQDSVQSTQIFQSSEAMEVKQRTCLRSRALGFANLY